MLTEVELLQGGAQPPGPFPAHGIQLDMLAALKSSGGFLARSNPMGELTDCVRFWKANLFLQTRPSRDTAFRLGSRSTSRSRLTPTRPARNKQQSIGR